MSPDLDALYGTRFPPEVARRRERVWREIAHHLQRYVRPEAVLDLACGEGYFIRNVRAGERWATDARDVTAWLPGDVRFVQCDGMRLLEALPQGRFTTVFISNYLEHLPSRDAVAAHAAISALKRAAVKPTNEKES